MIIDNIKFDSKIEADIYVIFRDDKDINILDIHKSFLISDKELYYDIEKDSMEVNRGIKYTPDFIIQLTGYEKALAVEVKGLHTVEYLIRKKLFISLYKDSYDFVELNSSKHCHEFLDKLKNRDKGDKYEI